MFDYVMAGNGIFLTAIRKEFSVCLPIYKGGIKGLPNAVSGISWRTEKVPGAVWAEILDDARYSCDPAKFREDVFIVYRNKKKWHWKNVSLQRTRVSTIADDLRSEYGDACIELHTHPEGAFNFSRSDDLDEQGKFRIFAILTDIHRQNPLIRFRCGVYEHFIPIHSREVSEMPEKFIDLYNVDLKLRGVQL